MLRPFRKSDLEDIYSIYRDPEVNRFLPWFPLSSREEALAYLQEHILPDYERDLAYRYAIELKSSRRVIGYIGISDIDEDKAEGQLGYGLRREYWNQGICSEAAEAVLARAQRQGFRSIYATHDVNNPGSGRVMEKIGMSYRYAYEEQWQPKDFLVTFKLYRTDFDTNSLHE